MDNFFNISFSNLFLEKHGENVFKNITAIIEQENSYSSNNNHVELVFKIAFLDYFGLNVLQIKDLIYDTMKLKDINIDDLKLRHKKSISEIQKYIKGVTHI